MLGYNYCSAGFLESSRTYMPGPTLDSGAKRQKEKNLYAVSPDLAKLAGTWPDRFSSVCCQLCLEDMQWVSGLSTLPSPSGTVRALNVLRDFKASSATPCCLVQQAVLVSGATAMPLILNFLGSMVWDINLCIFIQKDKATEPLTA